MITVKRESELETQEWRFEYFERGHVLCLSRWARQTRETKRHKFRVDGEWQVHRPAARGPVPPDVIEEARRQFIETLRVEG
jgi:hypothetical protein